MSSRQVCGPGTLVLLGLVAGCGGGGENGGGPSAPTLVIMKASSGSGDAQTGAVATPLAESLRVVVTLDGTPQSGTAVSWSASGTGAAVSPASSATDGSGLAATAWTLGQTAGAQAAQAAVPDASGSPVAFTATALPGAPAQVSVAEGNSQIGEVSTALAEPLGVRVADEFGNGVSGVTVNWSITSGDASLSAPSSTTSGDGSATVGVSLGGTSGAVTVTATVTGLAGGPASFSATAVNRIVQVGNGSALVFVPPSITIPAGGTVFWRWNSGSISHNVTTSSGSPAVPDTPSATNATPFTFGPVRIDAAGSYRYYCSVHAGPTDTQGMVGTITVQ